MKTAIVIALAVACAASTLTFVVYHRIACAKNLLERRFLRHAAVVCWITVVGFLVPFLLIPTPWVWFLWAPYGLLIPFVFICCYRTWVRIRHEEENEPPQSDSPKT